jgi:hypothetical protein
MWRVPTGMSITYLFPLAHTLWYFGFNTFVFPLEDLQEAMLKIKMNKIINRILIVYKRSKIAFYFYL